MSDPNDNPRAVTVPIPPDTRLGFVSTNDYLMSNTNVRVWQAPSDLVVLAVGSSQVVLSPEMWALVIGALGQVLPKPAAQLNNYTACEGNGVEDGAA